MKASKTQVFEAFWKRVFERFFSAYLGLRRIRAKLEFPGYSQKHMHSSNPNHFTSSFKYALVNCVKSPYLCVHYGR